MLTAQELQQGLSQFIGTENFYDAKLRFKYTDGVRWLAKNAECFWLLTLISSYQPRFKQNDFQIWILKKTGEYSAVAECWDDEPSPDTNPLVTQEIEFTDFPLEQIKLFLSHKVLMLPTEWQILQRKTGSHPVTTLKLEDLGYSDRPISFREVKKQVGSSSPFFKNRRSFEKYKVKGMMLTVENTDSISYWAILKTPGNYIVDLLPIVGGNFYLNIDEKCYEISIDTNGKCSDIQHRSLNSLKD